MSEPVSSEAEDEAALYEVAPEQFIASRDALVRRLRSNGQKADAARVAKRRRPPLTAWALNQVARTTPTLIEQLQQAGGQLRRAMEQALDGDASGLRQAQREERRAVDAVVTAAIGRLEEAGHASTDVMQQRLAATLRAAIVDERVADRLRRGELEVDYEAPGFGMDALAALPGRPATRSETTPTAGLAPRAGPAARAGRAGPATEKEGPDPASEARRAELVQRREQAQGDAERLAGEAAALAGDAERWAAEAARLSAESKAAADRAADARQRADAAHDAAVDRAAEADRLDHALGPEADR